MKKNNAVICFSWASREFGCNLCFKTKKDPEFISKGHSNWQKAEEQFEDDQKSNCHRTAVSFEVTVRHCRDVYHWNRFVISVAYIFNQVKFRSILLSQNRGVFRTQSNI